MDGFSDVNEAVKYAKENGIEFLSVSDHGNCAAHPEFVKAAKKAGIRFSAGIEFYICHEPAPLKLNRDMSHLVCWAKNKQGVYDLWKASSYANHEFNFYYKPRLNLWNWTNPEDGKLYYGLEHFAKDGNIKGFAGHFGSVLSDFLFCDLYGDPKKRQEDLRCAYNQKKSTKDPEYFRQFLRKNWLEETSKLALRMEAIFGKGNFAIEIQNCFSPKDKVPLYISPLIADCMREVSKSTGIIAVCSDDPHYVKPEDAVDQRAMVMINLKETDQSVQDKIGDAENDTMVFFSSDNFYIKSAEEMAQIYTPEELENSNKFNADVDCSWSFDNKPFMPNFVVPEFPRELGYLRGITDEHSKYLMYLAVEGAKKLEPWKKTGMEKKVYWDRLKSEFDLISKFGLSPYFLVVQDICYACDNRPEDHSFDWQNHKGKKDPVRRGTSRGSAGGCLISFLLEITKVDPLEYGLFFSRFLNTGRFTKDNISLCDIDTDVESAGRDWVINYMKHRYGEENVAQVVTFGRIKGRNAIKDLFRIKGIENGFAIANDICEHIPDEAAIADEIQQAIEDGNEDYGIIQWALDHKQELKPYYEKYKEIFDQAMRLEGKERSQGKHPSGIVITPKPVEECFPMTFDTKSKTRIVGLDYRDAEKIGACKLDILGVHVIDCLKFAEKLVNGK